MSSLFEWVLSFIEFLFLSGGILMIAGGIALVSLVYLLVTEKLDFYLQGKKWLTRICLVIGVGFILTLPEMLFGAHDGEQTPEIVTPDSAKEWGPLFGDSNQM